MTILHHELLYLFSHRMVSEGKCVIFWKIVRRHIKKKYGLEIDSPKIGKGLYLGHPYNITVSPKAVIGDNCYLNKGVTIGKENRGERMGAPVIGNKVWIGINAVIVGNITIGDDVLIAPNSFVNQDIPSHSIVIGNPCRIFESENATRDYAIRIV